MGSTSQQRTRRRPASGGGRFVLQWHLTARCNEDCRHCYAKDSPDLKAQLDKELDLNDCTRILASFASFLKSNGLKGRVNLTGGDPLLKEGVLELVDLARGLGLLTGILGNPSLLDLDMARSLKQAGVFRYQLSIDGLGPTHDRLRGRAGHFDDTLRALEILDDVGLPSVVMFTLSRENAKDLPAVAELVSERNVKVFDFARLVPQGRGSTIEMLGPEEYRNVLESLLETYRKLEVMGCTTHYGRKEALWNLLYLERGNFDPPSWDGVIHSGCSVGSKVLTVLADGTVYPCRRLPIKVGALPKDSFHEIFFKAKLHRDFRDVRSFKKCSKCRLLPYCRGCPAVAHGVTGDPFSSDPQCWSMVMDHDVINLLGEKKTGLKDHVLWSKKPPRQCASCDGACGGCGHVCASCSEVCAGCSGGN